MPACLVNAYLPKGEVHEGESSFAQGLKHEGKDSSPWSEVLYLGTSREEEVSETGFLKTYWVSTFWVLKVSTTQHTESEEQQKSKTGPGLGPGSGWVRAQA